MKIIKIQFLLVVIASLFISCNKQKEVKEQREFTMKTNDSRISLNLNAMQKQHQLSNMRSHLEAVQNLITLIANDDFDKAAEVAYTKLGSTTKMKLMCASFGNKQLEDLGLNFHKQADKMSEVIKTKDKKKSLQALSNTMNSCITCHATFRQ